MKKLSLLLALVLALSVMGNVVFAEEAPLKIRWIPYGPNTGEVPSVSNKTIDYLEKRFNIDIEIVEVSAFTEQWNVFWASNEGADYIQTNKGNSEIFKLVDQEMVRSIPKDWLHEYAPDLMAAVEKLIPADTLQAQISYNGENYIIPYTYVDNVPYYMATRSDYLERLGVTEQPKNLEEFHELCRKLTFGDPDGNGINDTYALTLSNEWHGFGYLSCYYGGWPDCFYLQDDNTVNFWNATEGWKKTLHLLQDWYAEGLIDPEFVTDDRPTANRKLAEGRLGFVVEGGGSFNAPLTAVKELHPDAELTYIHPFANEEGRRHSHLWIADGGADGSGFFGAGASDEVVKKILEIQNEIVKDPDLYRRLYYGEEGVDYSLDENGTIVKSEEQNTSTYQVKNGLGPTFCVRTQFLQDAMKNWTPDYAKLVDTFMVAPSEDYVWLRYNFVPPTTNQAYKDFHGEVKTIANEFFFKAVRGEVDIDAEWNNYINTLNQAGLQDILAEYNAMMAK